MEINEFINNYREAFGQKVELPMVFWYSDKPVSGDVKKINGCFFKSFDELRKGTPVTLSLDAIGCMGGSSIQDLQN